MQSLAGWWDNDDDAARAKQRYLAASRLVNHKQRTNPPRPGAGLDRTVHVSENVGFCILESDAPSYRSIMLQPSSMPTAMLVQPLKTPATPCPFQKPNHSPCRILSASCLFPKSHMFIRPCSERSMFFIEVMSCAGGLLTREATMTGSVSRMMPSSTSSSTASDCRGQRCAQEKWTMWLHTTRS